MQNLENHSTADNDSPDITSYNDKSPKNGVRRFFVNHRLQEMSISDESALYFTPKTTRKHTETELSDPSGKESGQTNTKEEIRNRANQEDIPKLASPSKKISKVASKYCNNEEKRSRQTWTSQEDQCVLDLIDKYGMKWSVISQKMGGTRTGKQIRERYLYKLHPDVKAANWVKSEDQQLLSLFKLYGRKWKKISELMPGRSEAMVKNRFSNIVKDSSLLDEEQEKGMLNNGAQSTAASGGASTSIELFSQDNDKDTMNICLNIVEKPFRETLNTNSLKDRSECSSIGTLTTDFSGQTQLPENREERKKFLISQIAQAIGIMIYSIKELELLL